MPRRRIGPNSNRRHHSRKAVTGKNGHNDHSRKTELGHMLIDNVSKSNNPKSPMKKGGKGWDRLQTGLSFAGTVFPQADALNALVSGGRAAYAKATGDDNAYKKHRNAAAVNALAIIPGVGETIKATKAGKILKTMPTQQVTNAAQSVKNLKNLKTSTSKIHDAINLAGTAGNVGYWGGTASQLAGEVKDLNLGDAIKTTNVVKPTIRRKT
jgi:hypothetical protein